MSIFVETKVDYVLDDLKKILYDFMEFKKK